MTCGYSCAPIVAAIRQQLGKLPVFDTVASDIDVTQAYAAALADAMPQPITRIFLCSFWSLEATECAVVLARAYSDARGEPERRTILRVDRGYHGATSSALAGTALTGNDRPVIDQAPGFATIASDRWDTLDDALVDMKASIAAVQADNVAAILIEPILGIAGIIEPPEGFLREVARLAAESGALLIVDEVLTGMGRTGHMFAVEHEEVSPDVLLASKGLTSGYVPLAAVGMTEHVYEALAHDSVIGGLRYGHTSSGHPLACAAGLATLAFTVEEGLPANAAAMGSTLHAAIATSVGKSGVRDVRGRGLLIGVEFETAERAGVVSAKMLDLGVIVRVQGSVITVAPPLIIEDEAREIVATVLARAMAFC